MIKITEKAINKIKEIVEEEDLSGQFLRVKLLPGGCAGFQFDLYFEESADDFDVIQNIEDINVVVSELTSLYIDDTEIDYVDGLFGAGFKFNNNSFSFKCGCGNSYSI